MNHHGFNRHLRGLLLSRLNFQDEGIAELRRRLIIKHDSEWYGKSDEPCWKKILDECGDKERPWLTQWRDDVEWMSQVEGFKKKAQRQVWHFHPLEFLAGIGMKEFLIDVDAFIEEYKKVNSSFSVAGVFTEVSENNLRQLVEHINNYYSEGCEYKPNLYKLSYMFATARHETFLFNLHPVEFFRSGPEVGGVRYFDKYDPVLAPEEYQRKKAIKNGNVNRGDGYKYRGRGLVHLTWHDNYKKAGDKVGVDLVANPDLAMDINNSVSIMIWGMEEGVFTGVGINRFEYAKKFQNILEKTSTVPREF